MWRPRRRVCGKAGRNSALPALKNIRRSTAPPRITASAAVRTASSRCLASRRREVRRSRPR
ncbi:hypothetical protein ACFQLY_27880, partial [Paraburkholderia dipogonis]|uniref:hypothetical protein n=1 Tax=Paraburkholderia dipogonis TaxID=1211383 RepID=UPI003616870D